MLDKPQAMAALNKGGFSSLILQGNHILTHRSYYECFEFKDVGLYSYMKKATRKKQKTKRLSDCLPFKIFLKYFLFPGFQIDTL